MSDANHSTCHYQYTVRRGDSFYLIAQRTGVDLRTLLEANPDIPPARLMIGDVLCIPYGQEVQNPAQDQPQENGETGGSQEQNDTGSGDGPSVMIPPCPPNRRTVVQNNQTAADLMLRYGLSYHTLQTANPGTDLEEIRGGDVLCIPQENTACSLATTVTLGENDTLETIATTYNVPVASLLRSNPCLSPNDFRAGTTIRLPE